MENKTDKNGESDDGVFKKSVEFSTSEYSNEEDIVETTYTKFSRFVCTIMYTAIVTSKD